MVSSALGDRENWSSLEFVCSGGKEVCRRGCDEAEVVDFIEALRRLVEGADVGISVCRRLRGRGRVLECDGW